MPTLVLGVVDVPYVNRPGEANAPRVPQAPKLNKNGTPRKARRRRHGPWQAGTHVESGEQTTGDVASWLENKYHIMEVFFELHRPEIEALIAQSMQNALEAFLSDRRANRDPFDEAMDDIKKLFNTFLDKREMDGLGDKNIPTQAAKDGVNHRLGLKKGLPRPSFIDTGMYEQSFKAWIEQA